MNITILGAGTIGCYCGGCLINAHAEVTFIGREKIRDKLAKDGLHLADLDGLKTFIKAEDISFEPASTALRTTEIILLTVKNQALIESCRLIKQYAPSSATVISLQNGIGALQLIKKKLPDFKCDQGMVGFNVVWNDHSALFRSSEGQLILADSPINQQLSKLLNSAGIPSKTHNDMQSVMWGKLCLNLNNALNMISGIPLKQQLEDRNYRKILAACIREVLSVARAKNIKPAKLTKVSARLLPTVLDLPNFLFKILASNMLKIDPLARSSMWDDMQNGRPSEIDYLNGAVQRAGISTSIPTPVNNLIIEITNEAFASGKSPCLSGDELALRLGI